MHRMAACRAQSLARRFPNRRLSPLFSSENPKSATFIPCATYARPGIELRLESTP
ncbi:MAG: hypothetical protein IPP35_06040 [Elusimicrobia bacterium]|nr:hypothetical protein [Elusimicrobiota bacterium]